MTRQVHIELDAACRGKITIDGEEVRNIRSLRFDAAVNKAATLRLELIGVDVTIDADEVNLSASRVEDNDQPADDSANMGRDSE